MLDSKIDFYEVLQLSPRANSVMVEAAFRTLLMAQANTSGQGVDELRQQIVLAHSVLSNPTKRAEYDMNRWNLQGKIVGDFRVLELIAEGATGDIYRGEHVMLGTPVCIKHCAIVSPVARAFSIDEAKGLWDLRHYSLPAIRNILQLADGSMAIVMSYIPGPTWMQMIEKNGAMHPEHVTWLAQRVLNALRYIHLSGGLIHGDINPKKIIIQPARVMAVLVGFDFVVDRATTDSKSKGHNDIFSPLEAIQGLPLLPASDLYSLGMTMIYALSGDLEETRRRSVPENTPEPLCSFIKRIIAEDVLDRPSWENEDLCDTLEQAKVKSFGKKSRIKPVPWQ